MLYLALKGTHLVGAVAWFAGLFYIVRLFIYDVEARARPDSERAVLLPQLQLMQDRLWLGITWPAMALTCVAGGALFLLRDEWRGWALLKLFWVALLVVYHLACGRIRRRLRGADNLPSSQALRFFNELATLLLLALVFTAVLKDFVFSPWSAAAALAVALLLGIGIVAYARRRRAGSTASSVTLPPRPA